MSELEQITQARDVVNIQGIATDLAAAISGWTPQGFTSP